MRILKSVAVMVAFILAACISNNIPKVQANAFKGDISSDLDSVYKLKGNARKEINTIANIIGPGSKMVAIDATKSSGEWCMLETVTKHNMVHYSQHPEKTKEDVVYYLNPATFIANGLDVSKLPRHPSKLGEMTPFQWYYYDGTYLEPHQGSQLNKQFVIMSIDVK
jgi:hypothetical protein